MIKFTKDISSETNIMEAELKENESIYLQEFCRLELIKRQNENFEFLKCGLRKL